MRVCILVICAPKGESERWDYERTVWKRYMHDHPLIDCFFLESHEEKQCAEDDVVYTQCQDSIKNGVLIKTMTALHLLKDNYDYFVRTNLSTFMILDRVYELAISLPTDKIVYTGRIVHNHPFEIQDSDCKRSRGLRFIGGTSIFWNKMGVEFLLDKVYSLSQNFHTLPDDVVIGYAFQDNGVHVFPTPRFPELFFWDNHKTFEDNVRKINDERLVYIRIKDMHDKIKHSEMLLETYYPDVVSNSNV